ncbi:PQQ-binding-like beta-propeller repeat protein [Krasilnikovia sp. MM14-A1259]|uniref:outer membrane protein assembly factor BamB family protein n=1 Tax=Krasilnikovia sp. MM14-A1259 TaxID=3373539 RepID=UPI00380767B3
MTDPGFTQDAGPGTPSIDAARPGPEPDYAEPVDPWADGEATAFAPGGADSHPVPLPDTWPDERGERPVPAYRKKWFWLVAAATAIVLGAGATLAVVFWPGYRALDYHALGEPRRVAPAVPFSGHFITATVRDDRAYLASVSDDGVLGIVAADTQSGTRLWAKTAPGSAEDWERLVALPDALVALSAADDDQRRLVLLDPGTGDLLWQRTVGEDDGLLFADDTVVLVDRNQHRLVGLETRGGGKVRWELKDPAAPSGSDDTAVYPAGTPDDLGGPATAAGLPIAPVLDGDEHIVQIGADRSARVIDAATGKVLSLPRQSVADPDDQVLAYDGRLIVAESDDARRIVAYDLAKLGEPRVLYTAPDTNTRFTHLTPCDADGVCFVQTTNSDAHTARVVAVNAAEGGRRWERPLADTGNLVPVGDSLLAAQDTSPAQVSLLGADGTVRWTREGAAARLDGGNMLRFAKPLSTSPDDVSVAGEHLGDDGVELGPLSGVRSATCAWNTTVLACAADKDFVLRSFAG